MMQIDFSKLTDLRIDYAFKLLFIKGEPRLLVSLLNAIFANKKLGRVVKNAVIQNPNLEKDSDDDKYSVLDIIAELDDGTAVLIEMHMHRLGELKSKTIRSWARFYGSVLKKGEDYSSQMPTISIAFLDGAIDKSSEQKIHKLCMIMDTEDLTVFTDAMELHYINMKAFAKAVNEKNSIAISDTEETMFEKWLAIITQEEITNKEIIKKVCEEEDLYMAVQTMKRYSDEMIERYLREKAEYERAYYEAREAKYERMTGEYERMAEENEILKQKVEELMALLSSKTENG